MTPYFKKITNLSLPSADPNAIKGELLFHYGYSRYYKISDEHYRDAIAGAFASPPKEIFLAEVTGPLNAHRDNGVSSCLNYYLRPAEYITEFWEPIENARRIKNRKYDSKTESYIEVLLGYEKNDLVLKDSFTAEAVDIYLLDISKVHSVSYHSLPKSIRSFVQCQWHWNMDQLITMISPNL